MWNHTTTHNKASLFRRSKSSTNANMWSSPTPNQDWATPAPKSLAWKKGLIIGTICMLVPTTVWAITVAFRLPVFDSPCEKPARSANYTIGDFTNEVGDMTRLKIDNLLTRDMNFGHGERVHLMALQASYQAPYRPVFEGCAPKSTANPIMQTQKDVSAAADEKFGNQYRASLPLIADNEELDFTPLLEGTATASTDMKRRYDKADSLSLNIISDGLHNVADISVYAEDGRFLLTPQNKSRLIREAVQHKKQGTYNGVDITFHIIIRYDHYNRHGRSMMRRQNHMMDFLKTYYEAAGAKSITIKPL